MLLLTSCILLSFECDSETHSGLITTFLSFICPHVCVLILFSWLILQISCIILRLLRNLYQFKQFTCHKQADTMTVIQKTWKSQLFISRWTLSCLYWLRFYQLSVFILWLYLICYAQGSNCPRSEQSKLSILFYLTYIFL